jgi:hypothetical protein
MRMILKCAMGRQEEEAVAGYFQALSTDVQYQEKPHKTSVP